MGAIDESQREEARRQREYETIERLDDRRALARRTATICATAIGIAFIVATSVLLAALMLVRAL